MAGCPHERWTESLVAKWFEGQWAAVCARGRGARGSTPIPFGVSAFPLFG